MWCKILTLFIALFFALHAKAGGTSGYQTIIESKLCKASLSNLSLVELANNLSKLDVAPLQKLLTDINSTIALQNNLSKIDDKVIDTWKYLYTNHSTKAEFARKDFNTSQQFGKLSDNVKAEIVQLTDASATDSRIIQFCKDLAGTAGFTAFLNDAKYFDFVKGFLGYRTDKNYTTEQYDELAERIDEINFSSVALKEKVKYWHDHFLGQTFYLRIALWQFSY